MPKKTCQQHKDRIEKYNGSLKELAEEVGNLKYDAFDEFLIHLVGKVKKDGDKDYEAGRKQLGSTLREASSFLHEAKRKIDEAWKISKKYM